MNEWAAVGPAQPSKALAAGGSKKDRRREWLNMTMFAMRRVMWIFLFANGVGGLPPILAGGAAAPPNPPAFVSVRRKEQHFGITFAAREGFADLLFRESRVCLSNPCLQ